MVEAVCVGHPLQGAEVVAGQQEHGLVLVAGLDEFAELEIGDDVGKGVVAALVFVDELCRPGVIDEKDAEHVCVGGNRR